MTAVDNPIKFGLSPSNFLDPLLAITSEFVMSSFNSFGPPSPELSDEPADTPLAPGIFEVAAEDFDFIFERLC